MRLPQRPPQDIAFPLQAIEWSLAGEQSAATEEYVRRANDACWHWDDLRRRPTPPGIDHRQAWAAVQFSRAGHFQKLPIDFGPSGGAQKLRFWVPPLLQEWLHRVDLGAGGSIGGPSLDRLDDDRERHLVNSLMEEAIASSQLEGASTTRRMAKEMLRTKRKPRNANERMILNNYRAILHIRQVKNTPMSPALLCELQEMLTRDVLESEAIGRFRRPDELIEVADNESGEAVFTPPSADSIASRIDQLCAFANDAGGPFVHPVIKAIALHFAIGYIHPFVDGNGRTARALFYWFMLRQGYWLFEFLPISRMFLAAPTKYARAYLLTETADGDLTYFLHHHLDVVMRAIEDLHAYIARKQREKKESWRVLAQHPGLNDRQTQIIRDVLHDDMREFTVAGHRETSGVGNATARSDLLGLVNLGLLQSRKRGQAHVYFPAADLRSRLAAQVEPNPPVEDGEPPGKVVKTVKRITPPKAD